MKNRKQMFDKCSCRRWQLSVPFCSESSEDHGTVPQGGKAITGCTDQWQGSKTLMTCTVLRAVQRTRSGRDQRKKDTYSSRTLTL